jgi:hypothetical protein
MVVLKNTGIESLLRLRPRKTPSFTGSFDLLS